MKLSPKRISQLGRVVTGKTPPTSRQEFFGGDYLFVTPSDLEYDHYYCRSTERTVTEEAKSALPNQFVPADAVMFTCIGATIGKCGIAPAECLTNQQVNSVVANENTDSKFLYYLLCHNVGVVKGIGGGSATPIVSKSKFEEIELPVPSLRDQQAIAVILSTYDSLIENNLRRMKLLEESARLLYREWFVRLRFPGHEHTRIINGVPEGWRKGQVGDLGEIITGKTPSTEDERNYGDDVQFIKTPDMHRQLIIVETEQSLSEKGANSQSNKFIPEGAILVACIGAKLGVVALTSERCQTNQQINAVIPHHDSMRYYSFFALRDLKPMLQAMGGGATMPNVNKNKFSNLPLLLPQRSLMVTFNEVAHPVFSQLRTLLLHNKNLKTARDLLLPKLMSGEIAV
jgi:type I restriction enzyme, S subunit